ncbi:uncharacterized protein VICG_00711 [Vittaforma corneae ATCC 50505]|uniref:Uncharacterized protein n=1 Tax=Vittaforma corneae (strain ATCC 50505) TaxID=993615 RepID=L2GN99_VITCO|nr:uncharacterized protein VICG_00711 [Vittaforma corneae ATCC 50505]ELA42311.1 hypothetical protein VICG_00711 [Vittaforma corneae ATCC 50505]
MDSLSLLKRLLTKIFKNEKISMFETQELLKDDMESNMGLEIESSMLFNDLNREDAVYLTMPFISGLLNSDMHKLAKYVEGIIQLDVFETKDSGNFELSEMETPGMKYSVTSDAYCFNPQRVYTDILSGKLARNDKIHIHNRIMNFRFDHIDWEDKDFLKEMMKFCFYKALLLIRTLINEDSIHKLSDNPPEENATPTQIYKLMPCGHLNPIELKRRDLLKRRLDPTQTLDEYVESLLKLQSKISTRSNDRSLDNDKHFEEGSEVQKLRQSEDFDDFRRNFRGNTKNIG